jgi:hypothetical protein
MNIVIDTGTIYRDPRLSRAHFRIVRRQAQDGNIQLVFPEVVVREAVGKFRHRSEKAYLTMEKAADELGRLGLPSPIPASGDQYRAVQTYERELRALCTARGAQIDPLPATPHGQLVDMAVAKRKPFNAAGAGYRDALIWETVAEQAANGPVAFVTTNTEDFADDTDNTRPAPDLVADLVRRGVDARRVTIFTDLRSFILEHVPATARLVDELADRFAHDDAFRQELFSEISDVAQDMDLDEFKFSFALPTDTDSPTVSWFEPDEVEVDDAHDLGGGDIAVDLTVTGTATIDCFVPKWSSWEDDANITINDADWNEAYVWADAERPVLLQVSASFDENAGEFSDLDVTHVEGR